MASLIYVSVYIQVPDWMLSIKKEKGKERRKLEMSAPRRSRISTTTKWDKRKAHHKREAIVHSKERKNRPVSASQDDEEEEM